jgi:hypothetical protein
MKFLSVLAVLPFAMAGYVHDCGCSTVKSYDSGVDDSSLVDTYYPTMSSCITTSYDDAGSPSYIYTSPIPSPTQMTYLPDTDDMNDSPPSPIPSYTTQYATNSYTILESRPQPTGTTSDSPYTVGTGQPTHSTSSVPFTQGASSAPMAVEIKRLAWMVSVIVGCIGVAFTLQIC